MERLTTLLSIVSNALYSPESGLACIYLSPVFIKFLASLPLIATVYTNFRHVQQGLALRLIVGSTNITTDASRLANLNAIARARLWYEQITTAEACSIVALASMHGVSPRYINAQMKLVQISPRLLESLLNRPESLPLSLDDLLARIPIKWTDQTISSTPGTA